MKKPKIRPRGKQVLVEPDGKEPKVSEHGIITPDSVEKEQKAIGTVIAIGDGIKDIKKGDRVMYAAFAGEMISIGKSNDEVDYILLFDEDILAFVED